MKKLNLRKRIIITTAILMLVSNLVLGAVLMNESRNAMKAEIDVMMLDIVNTASDMLDGDALPGIQSSDRSTPGYTEIYHTLSIFKENSSLEFLYVCRELENGDFIMVIDPAKYNASDYGEVLAKTPALVKAGKGVAAVDEKPYEDSYGRFYSAYSPVFSSGGKVSGVVAADLDADWYETQINRNARVILTVCIILMIIVMGIVILMTRNYDRQIKKIKDSLRDLENDIEEVTGDTFTEEKENFSGTMSDDGIGDMDEFISAMRDNLHEHVNHATTQANSMITAMASDYRCVYYVNLDENDGVCYRGDPNDTEHTPQGVHFPYLERFTYYAESRVDEKYREGFLSFIDPDNVRESLATQPIIAYRYLVRRQGHEYYEMIRMAGVRRAEDRDDHMVHAVGLGFTVIDEEMRESMAKNEALVEALAMAEEANKAKTAFLSNMSHEIRTPMNAIIGLDNLALHDETLSEQTRDYLEKIGGSAQHLLGLINDILDMSRIESGRIVLNKEEFSFRMMLEQINTMVVSQCEDKGLDYSCSIIGRIDDYYIGDDTRLKEVLINILSNAIKFTEAPGSVTMTVEKTATFEGQSTLKFRIKDTGIGMDPEYIPKIFEPFSQEDSSRKNKFGSTGLGMAITKNIVDLMNGTISVDSKKGVGTEFTVMITLKNSEKRSSSAGRSIDLHKLHVLIVDDEEYAAEHARTVLDEAGIRADYCTSGEEALRMIEVQHVKQEPYNLVLLDWKMPELDGLETAKRIRERYDSESTILMLTAYNWDEIVKEASAAGVDSFVSKPLFTANVLSELERVAGNHDLSMFKEKNRADLEGRRILLAEDIEINAEIMMDILEMEDMEADHAANGLIATELFRDHEPGTYSAILMDIRMPEMDGLEATAAIRAMDRADAKTIPIIALTANAFDEDAQRSLQAGMNAHLSKPVEPDVLYQTLGELIFEAEQAK